MILKGGVSYSSDCSDLAIRILKVHYRGDGYTKVKVILYNKLNGVVYERRTNYKLIHHQIQHWHILSPLEDEFQW